jgi:hypothetical protein
VVLRPLGAGAPDEPQRVPAVPAPWRPAVPGSLFDQIQPVLADKFPEYVRVRVHGFFPAFVFFSLV